MINTRINLAVSGKTFTVNNYEALKIRDESTDIAGE